ncbi:MAG: DUF3276 family protein [Bacteroidetes bacterium]|nr:DUF3276 family protein [Bacteroidota bacterium]
MAYENNDRKMESVYSKRIKAGKRRTYFFDVRETRGSDYYLTITESRKRADDSGYDRHKIFLYKEDFNKFVKALGEAVDYVKTDLMPDFDFDAFNHEYEEGEGQEGGYTPAAAAPSEPAAPSAPVQEEAPEAPAPAPKPDVSAGDNLSTEEVDKW